jgi:hypothetical protein
MEGKNDQVDNERAWDEDRGRRGRHGWHFRWEELGWAARAGLIVLGLVLAAGGFVLFGLLVMGLWNWLMPEIFKLPLIGFWQAWGLVLLSAILFKGGSGAGKMGSDHRRKTKLRRKMAEYHGEAGQSEVSCAAGPAGTDGAEANRDR